MKKLLCVFLALSLMLCGFALGEGAGMDVVEDDGWLEFEPAVTKLMDASAKDLISDGMTRALVTVTLFLDMKLAEIDMSGEFDFGKPSYVGKDGLNLIVYMNAGKQDVIVMYCPITGEASYTTLESMRTVLVETLLEETCSDGYYENDLEDLAEVMLELAEAVEK